MTSCLNLVDLSCYRSRNKRSTEYSVLLLPHPSTLRHTTYSIRETQESPRYATLGIFDLTFQNPISEISRKRLTKSIGFCQNGSSVLNLLQDFRRRHLRLCCASQMLLRQRECPPLYLQQGCHRECDLRSSMLVQYVSDSEICCDWWNDGTDTSRISPCGTMYLRARRDREPSCHGRNLSLRKERRR